MPGRVPAHSESIACRPLSRSRRAVLPQECGARRSVCSGYRSGIVHDPDDRRPVLLEGDGVDSSTCGHDTFGVRRGGFSPVSTSAFVAEALSRTQAIARGNGCRPSGSPGATTPPSRHPFCSNRSPTWASDNVVPIRLPEATEAFARGIGEVIGSDVTAVCVIESDTAIVLVVDGRENARRPRLDGPDRRKRPAAVRKRPDRLAFRKCSSGTAGSRMDWCSLARAMS